MASLHSLSLLPLFLSLFFLTTDSQNPTPSPCTAPLLPLLPCLPFVQGMAPSPTDHCCDGLNRLYSDQPQCLCLLLNNSSLASSFPINTSLALRLPSLCHLHLHEHGASCSGKPVPPSSPASQVSHGANTSTSTFAASPGGGGGDELAPTPRPSALGLGFGRSESMNLNTNTVFQIIIFMAFLCLI